MDSNIEQYKMVAGSRERLAEAMAGAPVEAERRLTVTGNAMDSIGQFFGPDARGRRWVCISADHDFNTNKTTLGLIEYTVEFNYPQTKQHGIQQ